MKLLLVDDSRSIRLITSRQLMARGYEIVEAENGRVALEMLESGDAADVDAALIDWEMPVMDGIALIRAVRENPSLAKVKLLLVTGSADDEVVRVALAAGADGYVTKPMTIDAVREQLGE